MTRKYTFLAALFCSATLFAASGGPDQYGYTWKDNAEADGPVYEWLDITGTGTEMTGFGDDNVRGPVTMTGNMPYYWYTVKNVYVGSNGYIAFDGGNIAATFPFLPSAGATNNYMAVHMADLTFTGVGNTAQVFVLDEPTQLVVSWLSVPFWSVNSPGYSGSNTFQVILNKTDSTITMQYQANSGINGSNGPVIGIESVTGDIGLARSQSLVPTAGYAVRYYNPSDPLLDITDGAIDWVGQEGTLGTTMAVNASLPMYARIHNTGNQPLDGFNVTSKMISPTGVTVLTETVLMGAMSPGGNFDPVFSLPFVPISAGTYKQEVTISGIPGEYISSNNVVTREVTVYDQTAMINLVDWAGPTDDFGGIAWNGGDGGIGVYILPPFYPCQVTGTTIRIASNIGSSYTIKVFDDDGEDGAPGTLLDSLMVSGADAGAGDHVFAVSDPIVLTEGGVYVQWYMLGPNVSLAVDPVGPFSLRCFEVLTGIWAEYRDRTTSDFHLGARIEMGPFVDVGCAGLIGLVNGQSVSASTPVTVLVQNYGNTPVTDIPIHYSFNNGPVTTQTYSGLPIIPGASAIVNFTVPFFPSVTAVGDFCVWTSALDDAHPENDSTCITLDVVSGIADREQVMITLMPNPAGDVITVTGLRAGAMKWEVFDAQGQRVLAGSEIREGSNWAIDTSGLADGSYVFTAISAGSLVQSRFVVQH